MPTLWLATAIVLVVAAAATKSRVSHAGNESSRLATVESLIERGTFRIDQSRFQTVDKVRIEGHFYSDKPPLYVLWLAAGYGVARTLAGLTFDRNGPAVIWWLNFLGGGLFATILTVLFFSRGVRAGFRPRTSAALAVAVILGTWLFSYSTTLNNHVPSACLLWSALLCLERALESGRVRAFLWSGVLLGLTLNLDIPHGLFFSAAALGVILGRPAPGRWKQAGACAGGVILLGLGFMVLNQVAHGSWRPAYLVPGGYGFPGDIHQAVYAGQPDAAHYLAYAGHALAGSRGLFSYMPVLLLALPALLARKTPLIASIRRFVLAGTLLSFLYHLSRTNDLGGWAYGYRFFIPLIPLLFWAAVVEVKSARRTWERRLFWPLVAAGVITAAVGAYNPWPVCDESAATSADAVEKGLRNTFVINLSALLYESPSFRPLAERIIRAYAGDRAWPLLTMTYVNQGREALARQAAARQHGP